MSDAEMLELKRRLYHKLIITHHDDLTDNEIDIAFFLSKDEQIQKLLDEGLKGKEG